VLNKTLASKPVKACISPVVFSAQWYQCFVVAFAPSTFPQVVKLYGRWIVFAMQVMAQGTAKLGHGLLVGFFILRH
jgi:hypothetical protein